MRIDISRCMRAKRSLLPVVVLCVLVVVVVYPTIFILPFADDAGKVYRAKIEFGALLAELGTPGRFWRPAEALVNWLSFRIDGGTFILTRLVNGILLVAVAIGVFKITYVMTKSACLAFLGGLVAGLHPVNHSAVAQIDTVSQSLANFGGLLVVAGTIRDSSVSKERGRGTWAVIAGTFCVVIGKETGFGTIIWGLSILGWRIIKFYKRYSRVDIIGFLITAGLVIAYFMWRMQGELGLMPVESDEIRRYGLQTVDRIVLNMVLYAGGLLYLGSTPGIIVGTAGEKIFWLVVGVLLSGALVLAGMGCVGQERAADQEPMSVEAGGRVKLLATFAVAGLLPAVAVTRVSELYVSGLVPVFASMVPFVVALRRIHSSDAARGGETVPVRREGQRRMGYGRWGIVVLCVGLVLVWSDKSRWMKEASVMQWRMMEALRSEGESGGEGREIRSVCQEYARVRKGYSVYALSPESAERAAREMLGLSGTIVCRE